MPYCPLVLMAHILSLLREHQISGKAPDVHGNKERGFNVVIAAGTPLLGKGIQSIASTIVEVGGVYQLGSEYLKGPKAVGVVDAVRRNSVRTLWIVECRLCGDWDPFELVRNVLKPEESQDPVERRDSVLALVDCEIDSLPAVASRISPHAICCLRESEKVVVSAIRSALEGAIYRSPKFQEFANCPHSSVLSQKEMATVVAIVQGLSIEEIAFNWNVSRKTVSTFRSRALKKLGLQSDVDLVRYMTLRSSMNSAPDDGGGGGGTVAEPLKPSVPNQAES